MVLGGIINMPNCEKLKLVCKNGLRIVVDYFPHKRIEFTYCGLRIKVCKPYGCSRAMGSGTYNIRPILEISANATIFTDFNELRNIEVIIEKCVEILDKESDGLSIGSLNFSMYNPTTGELETCYEEDLPEKVRELHTVGKISKKAFRYENLSFNKVYEDVRGKHWIFWGTGTLYEKSYYDKDSSASSCNRYGCNLVFLDFDAIMQRGGYWVDSNGSLIISGHGTIVDTYASKKRIVKEVQSIQWAGKQVIGVLQNGHIGNMYRLGNKSFIDIGQRTGN